MASHPIRALGVIKLLRFRDWVHFLPLALLPIQRSSFDPLLLLAALGAAACGLAFAFGFNLYHDDQLGHESGEYMAERFGLTHRVACGAIWASAAAAAMLAFLVGLLAFGAMIIVLVASYLYSGGPRLKRFPLVGTLLNVPIFVPLGLLTKSLQVDHDVVALLVAVTGFVVQVQLIHEICHAAADRRTNILTTALLIGPRAAKNTALITGIIPTMCFTLLGVRYQSWTLISISVLLASVQVFLFSTHSAIEEEEVERLRGGLRWSGLLAGGVVWLFLILKSPA